MPNLNIKRNKLKKDILQTSFEAGACHIGSALSCADILIDIEDTIRDGVFVFSKASGVSALYCLLADMGKFPKEKTAGYLKQYPLPSRDVPGVLWSGGSLGQGLPIACGLALADRSRDVYVLISDGEMNEGTTWESALFARQNKLTNLYVLVDANGYQAMGETSDILDLSTAYKFLSETLPNFKIYNTIKGDKVEFLQGTKGHYKNINEEELKLALKQII